MGAVKQDNMDGAIAFIEYYDQTENMVNAMKQYGSFPPKTEAAQDSYWTDDPIQKSFIQQLDTSIPRVTERILAGILRCDPDGLPGGYDFRENTGKGSRGHTGRG